MSRLAIGKKSKEDIKMTEEKKIIQLEKLLRNAPEIMTPIKVSRFSPLGKNRVYELIKTGELTSFIYQGTHIIAKSDLIEYLAKHSDDEPRRTFSRLKRGGKK